MKPLATMSLTLLLTGCAHTMVTEKAQILYEPPEETAGRLYLTAAECFSIGPEFKGRPLEVTYTRGYETITVGVRWGPDMSGWSTEGPSSNLIQFVIQDKPGLDQVALVQLDALNANFFRESMLENAMRWLDGDYTCNDPFEDYR